MGSQLTDDKSLDDAALLRVAVRNIGKLADALNGTTLQLMEVGSDIVVNVKYDDRLVRALESIADTLARLERS